MEAWSTGTGSFRCIIMGLCWVWRVLTGVDVQGLREQLLLTDPLRCCAGTVGGIPMLGKTAWHSGVSVGLLSPSIVCWEGFSSSIQVDLQVSMIGK